MKRIIKIGDKVNSKFGIAKVTHIELCEKRGEKYGSPAISINIIDKDRCVFDLDNKHWCYGYQITALQLVDET